MKEEKYPYKSGYIELTPTADGIHYKATHHGEVLSGTVTRKTEAKRLCEDFITLGKKPSDFRKVQKNKTIADIIDADIERQKRAKRIVEMKSIESSELDNYLINNNLEIRRGRDKRSGEEELLVHYPTHSEVMFTKKKISEQTKRIMSMKKALETDDKEVQKEHTKRILGEEWNKSLKEESDEHEGMRITNLGQLIDATKYSGHENDIVDFGKFKGKKVKDVPKHYIEWAVQETTPPVYVECEHCHSKLNINNPKEFDMNKDYLNITSVEYPGARYGADCLIFNCPKCGKKTESLMRH